MTERCLYQVNRRAAFRRMAVPTRHGRRAVVDYRDVKRSACLLSIRGWIQARVLRGTLLGESTPRIQQQSACPLAGALAWRDANISVKAVVQAPVRMDYKRTFFSLSNLIAHMSRELSPVEQVLPGSPRGIPRPDRYVHHYRPSEELRWW